jgi:protein-S-isoprenylcysteine O-methyltransferase Ste14
MALKTELRTQGDFLFKYRSYFPLIILLIALYQYVQTELNDFSLDQAAKETYEIWCLLICVFGLFIRVITIGFTADNTSGRNTLVGQVAESINTTGIYSTLRHPLYLGNFFMWLGVAALTHNLWFIVAFSFLYWLYYERIMYAEEAFLTEKFGDAYTKYAAGVPAFIPSFKKVVKPKYEFSWRKVIRQEKAGILNMFGVILLFRLVAEYIATKTFEVEDIWMYGFAASLVWYIVIKTIQKTTNVLAKDRD